MRISDWSSDVCSSDLLSRGDHRRARLYRDPARNQPDAGAVAAQSGGRFGRIEPQHPLSQGLLMRAGLLLLPLLVLAACKDEPDFDTRYDKAAKEIEARAKAMDADIAEDEEARSEEHTSELQSLMRIS